MTKIFTRSALIIALSGLFILPAIAQENALPDAAVAPEVVAPEQQTVTTAPPASSDGSVPAMANTVATDPAVQTPATQYEGGINPNEIMPIVFSYWERAAVNDARNARGLVRPPTDEELMRGIKNPQGEKVKPPPEEREIKLGGIVFVANNDWTIWLNGKRVTPDAIPTEVMDLKVYKEYVEMKWFDDYTNQIFPLRIRAHERFNIDTRIFLPG
jgi:hypothetical protein